MENNVKVEDLVRKWLKENGYDYEVRTYKPEEPAENNREKNKDTISVPSTVEDTDAFMKEFVKSFKEAHEVTKLKNSI